MHGDLCKHLGMDSSTDHPDRYSNPFLNAYTNRHLQDTGNMRKYHQIDVYIYQCGDVVYTFIKITY